MTEPAATARWRSGFVWLAGLLVVLIAAAWPTVTRVSVNHVVHERRIPLVVKSVQFLQRDARYACQARQIITGIRGEEPRVLAIYQWTLTQIQPQPREKDVVDDHVWNIIERGYGASDQRADVFTTLLAYAGIPAYWSLIGSGSGRVPVSFVLIDGQWRMFDVANEIIFRAPDGRLATVEELAASPALIRNAASTRLENAEAYFAYFDGFEPPVPRRTLRPGLQMPISRLVFELNALLSERKAAGAP